MTNFLKLEDAICSWLDKNSYDEIEFHRLALNLAENIYNKNDPLHVEAMKAARTVFTSNFDESLWRISLQKVANKLDEQESPELRIVWCALNKNTVFDSYGGEFLLYTAASAGLDTPVIKAIVDRLFDQQF